MVRVYYKFKCDKAEPDRVVLTAAYEIDIDERRR
jgi:hypothetical protein